MMIRFTSTSKFKTVLFAFIIVSFTGGIGDKYEVRMIITTPRSTSFQKNLPDSPSQVDRCLPPPSHRTSEIHKKKLCMYVIILNNNCNTIVFNSVGELKVSFPKNRQFQISVISFYVFSLGPGGVFWYLIFEPLTI